MRTLRKIGLAVVLAVLGTAAFAGDGKKLSLHGGVEWGYSMTAYEWEHYNYLTVDGERMNPSTDHFTIGWNAAIEGYGELCLRNRFALRLAGGYRGIYPERRGLSAAVRGSYFFKGYLQDSPLAFVEYSQLFLPTLQNQATHLYKAGGGYRIALGGWVRLDINGSLQFTQDHPYRFYDRIQGAFVEAPNLRRSDVSYVTLNLSLALNF